jgi:2-phospho-L-lactate guanylyltransferase
VRNDWTAVIPVKRLDAAKTRLRGAVPAARHADLALAMVRDTVAAVLSSTSVGEVLVVTDDPAAAAAVTALGARVVPERSAAERLGSSAPSVGPGAGINTAMRLGADVAAGLGRPRVVLAGDLPALRPEELDAALFRLRRRSFAADAEGSGTVLLAAPAGVGLDPHFGPGSAAAHAASGARALAGDWPGLRHDVDTARDLHAVLALGAGPYTCGLLRDLGRTAGCGVPAR